MTTINDDLAAIKAALDAGPTPKWYLRTNRHPTTDGRAWGWLDAAPPGGSQVQIPGVPVTWERGTKSYANATYIAACSPDRIARLVEHVERLEAALRNSGLLNGADAMGWDTTAIRAALEGKE